jgi:hypothetical protein
MTKRGNATGGQVRPPARASATRRPCTPTVWKRALAFELLAVRRVERILTTVLEREAGPTERRAARRQPAPPSAYFCFAMIWSLILS